MTPFYRSSESLCLYAIAIVCVSASVVAPRAASAQVRSRTGVTSDLATSIVPLGTKIRLQSKSLGEIREVIVATPPSYSQANSRFPVVYVLDGGQNLLTTVSAARALASAGRIPDVIVVAILNTQRDRDFTPALVRTSEMPPGVSAVGGADAFLRFIGTELVPAIDARYRTQPMRAVIGHSLGGLLAMRALATAPTLFRAYLTLEPSLWWDARQQVLSVLDSLRARPAAVGRLVAVEATSDEGWKPDWAALQQAAPSRFRLSFVHIDDESHENLPYRGIYEGLASLFFDYMPAMRHDLAQGTLAALQRQYSVISRDFGYTVKPPLSAILTVANRESGQRRFTRARSALAYGDSLYPGSSDTQSFRAAIDDAEREAKAAHLGEQESVVKFKPITRDAAVPVLGDWDVLVRVEPGTPMKGRASFRVSADSLLVKFVARGVAIDGGDLVEPDAPVRVEGDSLFWERENNGGGRAVTSARIVADGRIQGEETLVGGRAMPAGFTMPKVTVEMTRASIPRR
ncbi:MAG TPA: alpha/beta hydrolase-fold protein [Gemmatimonadaceae bacterium]|nr:alpha/beta hydrolase-fold protein [Gemmatimonadaceae bacterium]